MGVGLRYWTAAITRIGFLDVGRGAARRGLEQFLQEGGLTAARRGLAALEGDHMPVSQSVMAHVRHLVALVEIDRKDLALQDRWREEGNLFFRGRDVVPAIIAEGGGGGRITQPRLHA